MNIGHHFTRKLGVQKTNFTRLANVTIECDPEAAGGRLAVFGARFLGFLIEKTRVDMQRLVVIVRS